jgi:hypothetical protein
MRGTELLAAGEVCTVKTSGEPVLPAGIDEGLSVYVAPAGSPVIVKVMAAGNEPYSGVIDRL